MYKKACCTRKLLFSAVFFVINLDCFFDVLVAAVVVVAKTLY